MARPTRVLLCTGKIGHELRGGTQEAQRQVASAIVFLDQLYPLPEAELAAEMDRHAQAREFVWVQEEPGNMGALAFVLPRLERLARGRASAFGQAFVEREPGDGLPQSARDGAEDARLPRVWSGLEAIEAEGAPGKPPSRTRSSKLAR